MTLSPLFQEFVDDAGPLETYARPASPDALQGLPRTFVDLVEEVGFAFYADGLVRLVDPGRYRSVLGMFPRDDPDFSPEHCHVIAVGAFGTLVGWSEKHGSFGIDPLENRLRCSGLLRPKTRDPAIDVSVAVAPVDYTEAFDLYSDETEEPLHAAARERLGPLAPDEIYASKLPPALGGARELGNLKRVKALEQLAVLAQLEPLKLMDMSPFPARFVRNIG